MSRAIRRLARSAEGSNMMSFVGGLQLALGGSTLISIAGRGKTAVLLAALFVAAGGFLLGGFLSMRVAWEFTELRLKAERAHLTILSLADVVDQEMKARVSLLGWSTTRSRRILILLVLDSLLSAAGVVMFIGTVLWW